MTKQQAARQTALELVQRFGMLGMKWAQTDYFTLDKENAKQCAIIACEEIIKAIDWHNFETPNVEYIYWEKIIQEINKL